MSVSRRLTNDPKPSTVDFYLGAANQDYSNIAPFVKNGYASAIPTGEATVADNNLLMVYPAAAIASTVSSASANDTAAGTGARTVTITYLTTAYALVTDTLSLNGQTGVALSQNLLRCLSIEVATAGSGGVNAGIIYVGSGTVTTGVPAVVYGTIGAGDNKSQNASYTVPAGYTLFVDLVSGITAGTANIATVRLVSSTNAGPFKTQLKFKLGVNSGIAQIYFDKLLVFQEKTDIEIRALSSATTTDVGATIVGFLVTN